MRFGYAAWGFLGDTKLDGSGNELSSPDGNAAYSWSILWEAQKRGWTTYWMHHDRDKTAFSLFGKDLFSSFSQQKRVSAYLNTIQTGGVELPELDVVLVEWRWPIVGRNTFDMKWKPGYQPDLERQSQILNHYANTTAVVVLWDLDHKLTYEDEDLWQGAYQAIFETSIKPLDQHFHRRTSVNPPVVVSDLMQHPTNQVDPNRKLVYVGSRYERDDAIDAWIRPVSDAFPGQVEFWGKWTDADKLWPNVRYMDRITMRDFSKAYGTAVACPLLAKRSYLEQGFISPRPWEALMFGTLPIGLDSHLGVERYTDGLVALDANDLIATVDEMSRESIYERHRRREELAHKLQCCDASRFVDHIEDVMNGAPPNSRPVDLAQKEEG